MLCICISCVHVQVKSDLLAQQRTMFCMAPGCKNTAKGVHTVISYNCAISNGLAMCSSCARKKMKILLDLERIQIDSIDFSKLPLIINKEGITSSRLSENFEWDENFRLQTGYMLSSLWRALLINPHGQRLFIGHLHQEMHATDKNLIEESGFCDLQCPPYHELVAVDQHTFANVQMALHVFCHDLKRRKYGFQYVQDHTTGDISENDLQLGNFKYKMRYIAFHGVSDGIQNKDSKSNWMPYALTKTLLKDESIDFVWAMIIDKKDKFPNDLLALNMF